MEWLFAISDSLALDQLGNFHFLRPWWLLFALPAAYLYWTATREPSNVGAWKAKMSPVILEHLVVQGNTRRWFSPRRLFLPFLLIGTLVLSGPSWKQQASPFLSDESVLVVALDLSSSMREADLKPSRMLRAKQKINELLDVRGDSNTALIAFAGTAHIAMPITTDISIIKYIIDVLDWQAMPQKQKRLSQVVPQIDRLLAPVEVPATVLLLTDQADQEAVGAFSEYFSSNEHQLIVWSMNKEGSDVSSLENLSSQNQGQFVAFSLSGDDVAVVNRYTDTHLVVAADSALPWQDAGYYLLYPLAIIQLLWFRKGWTLKW